MRLLLLLLASLTACGLPDNPPVTQEIKWVDARTEQLARRACYDCHSNETDWELMHRLPIVNSIVKHDVFEGRCHMNFSEWDRPNEDAWEAPEKLREGEMPLPAYVRHHKEARLTDQEVELLARGLEATFDQDPPLDGGDPCDDDGGDDDDDDRDEDDDDDDREEDRWLEEGDTAL